MISRCLSKVLKLKWLKVSFLAMIFIFALIAVFLISTRMAAENSARFPAFQDSTFTLIDQTGVKRSAKDFLGQPIALFFGFTYCPDTCPTTLATLAAAQDELSAKGYESESLQILFVSIDPLRDTPSQLNSYLSLFDVKVSGLTGSATDIEAVLSHFSVYAEKTGHGDSYLYDHSAAVYLYRADGSFKGTIVHNEPMEYIAKKIKSIL